MNNNDLLIEKSKHELFCLNIKEKDIKLEKDSIKFKVKIPSNLQESEL